MIRRLALLPLVLLTSTLFTSESQGYTLYLTDGNEAKCNAGDEDFCPQPLRWWRRETVFTLAKVEPAEFDAAEVRGLVETSFDAWINADCSTTPSPNGAVPIVTFAGLSDTLRATPPATAKAEPDNVIVFIRSTSEWTRSGNSASWIAITKIAHDQTSGEIVDADMEINDGGYKFSLDGTPTQGEVDFLSMLIHEVGHFYGLDHSLINSATMFATYSQVAGEVTDARTLDADDVTGVCALYTDVPERGSNNGDGGGGCNGGSLPGLLGLLALAVPQILRGQRRRLV
jgi:hypothetical protein